jgi:aspartate/methionine/tyrosine aminotransferase
VEGDALTEPMRIAREGGCALLMDEFYSHYVYDTSGAA